MSNGVRVVCTIGATMRDQRIGVAELQRRLAARGTMLSRGALDRLVSDRPITSVKFDLLLAILDVLGISLAESFATLSASKLERTSVATCQAREASRAIANGTPAPQLESVEDGADEADERTIRHLEQRLRRQHREAFDKRCRLRRRALTSALVTRFGGRRVTREQVDDLIAAGRDAGARRRVAG